MSIVAQGRCLYDCISKVDFSFRNGSLLVCLQERRDDLIDCDVVLASDFPGLYIFNGHSLRLHQEIERSQHIKNVLLLFLKLVRHLIAILET